MTSKFILTCLALGLQYLLLNSHKMGKSHWIWIAPVSVSVLVVGSCVLSRSARRSVYLVLFALLSVVLPSAVYAMREWIGAPAGLSNVLAHDSLFYLTSTSVVTGGWIFAALLVWMFRPSMVPGQP